MLGLRVIETLKDFQVNARVEVSSVHLTLSSSPLPPPLSLIFEAEAATNSVLFCISSFLLFSKSMADFISVLLLYYYICKCNFHPALN